MRFCPKCDNMFYVCLWQPVASGAAAVTTEDTGSANAAEVLRYYCRQCRTTDDGAEGEWTVVVDSDVCREKKRFEHMVNPYTKFDPTLPALKNVPCPNAACASNTDEGVRASNEVIYVRYDDDNLKYLYLCSTCDTQWKTGGEKV